MDRRQAVLNRLIAAIDEIEQHQQTNQHAFDLFIDLKSMESVATTLEMFAEEIQKEVDENFAKDEKQ